MPINFRDLLYRDAQARQGMGDVNLFRSDPRIPTLSESLANALAQRKSSPVVTSQVNLPSQSDATTSVVAPPRIHPGAKLETPSGSAPAGGYTTDGSMQDTTDPSGLSIGDASASGDPSQNTGLGGLDVQALASPAKPPVTASPPGGSGTGNETQIGTDGKPVKDYGSADRPDARYAGDTVPSPTGGDTTGTPGQTGTSAGNPTPGSQPTDYQTAETEARTLYPDLFSPYDPRAVAAKTLGPRPTTPDLNMRDPMQAGMAYLIPMLTQAISGNPYVAGEMMSGTARGVGSRNKQIQDYDKALADLTYKYQSEHDTNKRAALGDIYRDVKSQRDAAVQRQKLEFQDRVLGERARHDQATEKLRQYGIEESAAVGRERTAAESEWHAAQTAVTQSDFLIHEAAWERHMIAAEGQRSQEIVLRGQSINVQAARNEIEAGRVDGQNATNVRTHYDALGTQIDNLRYLRPQVTDPVQQQAIDKNISDLESQRGQLKPIVDRMMGIQTGSASGTGLSGGAPKMYTLSIGGKTTTYTPDQVHGFIQDLRNKNKTDAQITAALKKAGLSDPDINLLIKP